MPEVGELYVKITARMDELERQLKKVETDTPKRLNNMAEKSSKDMLRTFGDFANKVGNVLSVGLTVPMAAFGKSAFDASVKSEALDAALEQITGSAQKAAKEKAVLRKMADDLAVNFQALEKASFGVIAGFKGNVEESNYVLKNFSALSSAMKISRADYERVTLNLTQIAGSAKLTGDELREMAAILPGLRPMLEKAFGTSSSEELAKLGITGKQALQAIAWEIEHGGIKPNLNTMASKLQEFENLWTDFKVEAGNALIPLAKEMLPELTKMLKEGAKLLHDMTPDERKGLAKWGIALAAAGPIMKGFSGLLSIINGIVSGIKVLQGATLPTWLAGGAGVGAGGIGVGLGASAGTAWMINKTFRDDRDRAIADDKAAWGKYRKEQMDELATFYLRELDVTKNSQKAIDKVLSYTNIGSYGSGNGVSDVREMLGLVAKKYNPALQVGSGGFAFGMQDYKPGTLPDPRYAGGLKNPYATAGSASAAGAPKTEAELSAEFLVSMAKGISTPAGQASCAYFASQMLKATGVAISKEASAKSLIDAVKAKGGVEVKRSAAMAGDLVYYYGDGYGAIDHDANKKGQQGYHVGIYKGDGTVVDSSGGQKRYNRGIGSDARFVRPLRAGQFQNVGDVALERADAVEAARKEAEKIAKDNAKALAESYKPTLEFFNNMRGMLARMFGGSLKDQVSIEKFGRAFGTLNSPVSKNEVMGDYWDRLAQGKRSDANWKDGMEDWRSSDSSRRNRAMMDRAKGKWKDIFDLAGDKSDERSRNSKQWGDYKDAWRGIFNKAGKEGARIERDALNKYSESMADLDERLFKISGTSKVATMRLQGLTMEFLRGRSGSEALADASTKAKAYMELEAKVIKAEQWKQIGDQLAREMTGPIREAFGNLIRLDFPDLLTSFNSLLDNIIRTIAERQIELTIQNGVGDLIGGYLGGMFGGGGRPSIAGAPAGYDGANYGGSSSLGMTSAAQSRSMGGITIVINATDAQSVINNADQVAVSLGRSIEAAKRKI
jgi:tape measure domain-containing protein